MSGILTLVAIVIGAYAFVYYLDKWVGKDDE